MFFYYLFIFINCLNSITKNDLIVGVWSGFDCIYDRVLAISQTWIKQFPKVYIFSDYFPRNAFRVLTKFTNNIELVPLGNCAKHLWFPNNWQSAQPRFLRAIHELYKIEPHKKWYVFVDDDSYLFLNNTLNILSNFNSSEKIVVGRFYCAWPKVVFGNNNTNQCMNFPQGGAGIALSEGMLAFIDNYLLECNDMFNDKMYAGSMRLAKCINDHVIDGTWTYKRGIQNYKSYFHSNDPITEIGLNACHRPPATFHKVSPKLMKFVYQGHFSEWTAKNENGTYSNFTVDWSHLTCRSFPIYLDEGQLVHLRFGYAISLPQSNTVIFKSTTPLNPIFTNGIPTSYEQNFGNYFKIIFHCDEQMNNDNIYFISSSEREYILINMTLKCPLPTKY